ncbi:propanediol utilization protein [Flavobacterium sp. ALD4]|uniref:zinc-dependent metalloprotease n=1 Tax=Flavobacterium sp. ALD4 TaxID=2058314 RepID=UPI000C322E94|nr:zinc-dependent metalloprotease family protein [Flavobacterium sp. ALD4]PKH66911.1 propanediol utilization protein [Flavobacterium sp. ALD4]
MKKSLLILLIAVWCLPIHAQNEPLWKRVGKDMESNSVKNIGKSKPNQEFLFRLDEDGFKKLLLSNQNKTSKSSGVEITIPNLNGVLEKFLVWESSNFEPELQAKYPNIRAYAGVGITDPRASLNFSLSPQGLQTMILRADSGSEFIESYQENPSLYVLFSSKNRDKENLPFVCKTEDLTLNKQLLNETTKIASNNKVFNTLRLGLSCTGEYAAYHGGTKEKALAAMNATMSRVNGIFNKDLAVQLVLIANNDAIVYLDAATDPYSAASTGATGAWSQEAQATLTNVIGEGNYDIGHLFGATGGGGNAGCIGCVCVSPTINIPLGKGSAYTSPADGVPQGDTFDIDFVVHEIGHQLGANHTFSHELEETPVNVNVEPGSGSTIMGYAGITTDYDVQASSDDYFAYVSILQIQTNLATKTCPTKVMISNNPPVVNAGADYTIPKGTAFVLKGTGTDATGDVLMYTWEQNDAAVTSSGDISLAVATKPDGPLFRSVYPSASPVRYMPLYSNVLSNKLRSKWESVSDVARALHFTLTARDNAPQGTAQTNTDGMTVNVSGTAGPFVITSQNTDNLSWFQGQSNTINWSVNNTNTLPGSANVNIRLSVDGGATFPTLLVSNTPNDGSEVIIVPNVTAKNCRILIEPVGNIYYVVNSTAFAIGYSVESTCTTYTFAAPFVIPEQVAYTARTITVPSTLSSVADVNFNVSLTHSYLSDVEMEVISAQGTTVKLFDRSCGNTNSTLLLSYDDSGTDLVCAATSLQTVVPFQALAVFNGENPQGDWTFKIRDAYKTDAGMLNSASINICTKNYTLVEPDFELTNFILYPNPNKGSFILQFISTSKSGIKIVVHDVLGRKIFENAMSYRGNYDYNENIQLVNTQPGFYFLTIIDGSKKEIKKILIY